MICTLGVLAEQADVSIDPGSLFFRSCGELGKSLKTREGHICLSLEQKGEMHKMTLVIKDIQFIDLWEKSERTKYLISLQSPKKS